MGVIKGGPSSLTVIGGSGIGKTALWRYAVAWAREQGFRVLLSRPAEEEMPLSGVGLTDLFESVRLVGLTVGTDDLYSTGRSVLTALRDIAADEPLVLAVDDVQWLDSFSARVLRYALRRLEAEPIAIVTTFRSDDGGSDPLASSATLPLDRQVLIEPGPLGVDDIRRLIGDTAGAVPRPTLRRIHRISAGNPLYALELARTLQTQGSGASGDPLLLPDSVQTAIGDRIDSEAGDLWPLLEVVSAIGHPSVGSLRRIQIAGDLDRLLAAAQQGRLLVVEEDLTVRFSHPIVGSVVYARIDPIARRDLHGRLAELATDPDVRARHLALSREEADEEVAALLEDAAGRAGRRGAPDLAAEFIAHSLRLTPGDDEAAARRRRLLQIEDLAASGKPAARWRWPTDCWKAFPTDPTGRRSSCNGSRSRMTTWPTPTCSSRRRSRMPGRTTRCAGASWTCSPGSEGSCAGTSEAASDAPMKVSRSRDGPGMSRCGCSRNPRSR